MNKYEQIVRWAMDCEIQVSYDITARNINKLASDKMCHVYDAMLAGKKVLTDGEFRDNLQFNARPDYYTVDQEMIKVGKVEFPKPISDPPNVGTVYHVVRQDEGMIGSYDWTGCSSEVKWLKANICHLDKENAQQHLDALNKISAGEA